MIKGVNFVLKKSFYSRKVAERTADKRALIFDALLSVLRCYSKQKFIKSKEKKIRICLFEIFDDTSLLYIVTTCKSI